MFEVWKEMKKEDPVRWAVGIAIILTIITAIILLAIIEL